jgi:hypothetical protein
MSDVRHDFFQIHEVPAPKKAVPITLCSERNCSLPENLVGLASSQSR